MFNLTIKVTDNQKFDYSLPLVLCTLLSQVRSNMIWINLTAPNPSLKLRFKKVLFLLGPIKVP